MCVCVCINVYICVYVLAGMTVCLDSNQRLEMFCNPLLTLS